MRRQTFGKGCRPVGIKDRRSVAAYKGLDTYNNGRQWKRIAKHQEIAEKLEISFYFCTSCHSWERGANENMNGLIGRYIPKGTDFSEINDEFVAWVENKLNNRPRKRLGYLIPNEKFNSILTNQNSIAFAS